MYTPYSVPVQIGASVQDEGWLTHAQSQVPVIFIVLERFSVDKRKRYKNASVDDILLCLRCREIRYF